MTSQPPAHCRPDCPHFGRPHDNVYLIECECGEEELTCGYCMAAGRIDACRACTERRASKN